MPALVLGVSSTSPLPRLICSLVTTWSEASARLTAAWRHVVPAGDADLVEPHVASPACAMHDGHAPGQQLCRHVEIPESETSGT